MSAWYVVQKTDIAPGQPKRTQEGVSGLTSPGSSAGSSLVTNATRRACHAPYGWFGRRVLNVPASSPEALWTTQLLGQIG